MTAPGVSPRPTTDGKKHHTDVWVGEKKNENFSIQPPTGTSSHGERNAPQPPSHLSSGNDVTQVLQQLDKEYRLWSSSYQLIKQPNPSGRGNHSFSMNKSLTVQELKTLLYFGEIGGEQLV